ncbi:hypothetical protein Nepgr_012696 [Nepenthes gracilis]|uniref:Homeobox protein knotted-1-like 3 n=1 Tax=Nepenthes gracilis TaxID=150966 RepID=A0AAD3SHC9_NEPGR|nr:hypothetical protein Nepgr_012696 [Nepenthes gracilis]
MASHNQHRHLSQEQMPFHLFTDQTAPPEFRTILPDYLREQQVEAAQKEDWPRRHHLGTGPNWLSNTILRPQTTTYGTVNVQNNQNSNNITASNNFLNLYSKFDSSAASQQTSNQWLSRTTIDDSVVAPYESLGLSSNNNDSNEINYINNKDNGNNCGSKDELTEDELDVGVDGGGGDGMSVVNWQNTKRKAEILAHPLYGQLLSAHVACLRIATPVDQLPMIHAQLAHSQHVVSKYSKFGNGQTMVGDDEELDQFMTHYVLLLCSFREQLQQHIRVNAIEAIMACWEIEQSFQSLTGVSAGEGTSESVSDDDDYPEDNSDTNLFDGLDGPHSMGFRPPIPIESERSLIGHVRQELMHELKQGYKEKIVDVREEILRKRRAGRLPGDTTSVLKAWWQLHSKWPYPTEEDKETLVQETGLHLKQINNWFINQRKRNWNSNPSTSSVLKRKCKRSNADKSNGDHLM